MLQKIARLGASAACAALVTACTDSSALDVPETYRFTSRFAADQSSVSYPGQTLRHALISELVDYLDRLTAAIDSGAIPTPGEVESALMFYYAFDSATSGDVRLHIVTKPPLLQATFADLASGKNLKEKVAGNDAATDRRDWSVQFQGWDEVGIRSPDGLIRHWIGRLDALAVARGQGSVPLGPDRMPIGAVYLTEDGRDLKQLLHKFLLGAIAFSQATDDYLDSATEGNGLRASNAASPGKPYSSLEHHWDEAFGYFGAAQDYTAYSDEEIAGKGGRPDYQGHHDSNGDGAIDLGGEYNTGHAINAAKRDLGSAALSATDYSASIMNAFLRGRAIIWASADVLSGEQMDSLERQRDIIVSDWEKVIAATAVHYINKVLQDIDTFDTTAYDFARHAKHWSELKGFALGLQFSPFSPLGADAFAELHRLIGRAPVLPNAASGQIEQARQDLVSARDVLQRAYAFSARNMGDANGRGGW